METVHKLALIGTTKQGLRFSSSFSNHSGATNKIQILKNIKSGGAGVRAINDYFHQALSVGQRRMPSSGQFAVGDPVIYLENDYERMLFNGTLGRINDVSADESGLYVNTL